MAFHCTFPSWRKDLSVEHSLEAHEHTKVVRTTSILWKWDHQGNVWLTGACQNLSKKCVHCCASQVGSQMGVIFSSFGLLLKASCLSSCGRVCLMSVISVEEALLVAPQRLWSLMSQHVFVVFTCVHESVCVRTARQGEHSPRTRRRRGLIEDLFFPTLPRSDPDHASPALISRE